MYLQIPTDDQIRVIKAAYIKKCFNESPWHKIFEYFLLSEIDFLSIYRDAGK